MANSNSTPRRQSVEIDLLGQRFILKSTDTDSLLVKEVLDLITSRVDETQRRLPKSAPAHQIALLALLDLAEEYTKAKRRTAEYRRQIEERSTRLLDLVQPELGW